MCSGRIALVSSHVRPAARYPSTSNGGTLICHQRRVDCTSSLVSGAPDHRPYCAASVSGIPTERAQRAAAAPIRPANLGPGGLDVLPRRSRRVNPIVSSNAAVTHGYIVTDEADAHGSG